MHTTMVGFVFLIMALASQVDTAPVDDGGVTEGSPHDVRDRVDERIKNIKENADLSDKEKHNRMAVIRHNLESQFKMNHKEIVDIKDVYKSQRNMGHKLKNVHVAEMTDEEKKSIGKLRKEYNHNMQEIQHVLSAEHKKQLRLKHVLKKLTKGTEPDGGR